MNSLQSKVQRQKPWLFSHALVHQPKDQLNHYKFDENLWIVLNIYSLVSSDNLTSVALKLFLIICEISEERVDIKVGVWLACNDISPSKVNSSFRL